MKMKSSILFALLLSLALAGCGGGGAPERPEGPILSVSEALAIVVDQFYAAGGLGDEVSGKGQFSIYLRDAATGQDIACTSQSDGMKKIQMPGIWAGGLTIALQEVEGTHPDAAARFQIVFVEADSEGCPKGIALEDDIVDTSEEFSFDSLLKTQIWSTDKKAFVVLRSVIDDPLELPAIAASGDRVLAVDKLYFTDGSEGEDGSHYYLFAENFIGDEATYLCQVDDALMNPIRYGGITYASLMFPFACLDASDASLADSKVRIGLYAQRESGPELVAMTDARTLASLFGEKVPFADGRGFISFRDAGNNQ